MSRLKFEDDEQDQADGAIESFAHWTETDALKLSEIQQATLSDPVLRDIKRRIKDNVWSGCSMAERPYKSVRQRLTVENEVVCLGDLIVSPAALRSPLLEAVHSDTHCSALATRNRLKREAWWPGHCEDVERYVSQCVKCAHIRRPTLRTTHTWPKEEEAWQRVHIES